MIEWCISEGVNTFYAFNFIPTGRAVNPTTGSNWEGTGVEPDIKVPEAEALAVAQMEVLKAFKAKAVDSRDKARYDWSIEALEAEKQALYDTLADPALYRSSGAEIARLQARLDLLEPDLQAAYARWEQLEAIAMAE